MYFQLSVIFARPDSDTINNMKYMIDIWKNVGVSSDIETLRIKMTYLTLNIRSFADIIMTHDAAKQNLISKKMMEFLL